MELDILNILAQIEAPKIEINLWRDYKGIIIAMVLVFGILQGLDLCISSKKKRR